MKVMNGKGVGNRWTPNDLSVRALARQFSQPTILDTKERSPHTVFVTAVDGSRRRKTNVLLYTAVVVDFDDTDLSFKQLTQKLKKLNYRFIAHTTFSHKLKGNYYRVIFPLSSPQPYARYHFLHSLIDLPGIDRTSDDQCRLFFDPSCPADRKQYFQSSSHISLNATWLDHASSKSSTREDKEQHQEEVLDNMDKHFKGDDWDEDYIPKTGERDNYFTWYIGLLTERITNKQDILQLVKAKNDQLQEPMSRRVLRSMIKRFFVKPITEDWVYVQALDRFYSFKDRHLYSKESFQTMTDQTTSKYRKLVKANELPSVHSLGYYPGSDLFMMDERHKQINTWRPTDIIPIPGTVKPMLRHFKKIWGDDSDHILDWLAHILQRPEEKLRWGIITKSVQGVGKSLLVEFLFKIIYAKSNVRTITKVDIEDTFNTWVENQLIIIEEAQQIKEEFFKILIGNDIIPMRGMYQESREVNNPCAVLGFTNSEFSITHIDESSRRLLFCRSDADKMTSEESSTFIAWLKTHTQQILFFFQNRDLTDFDFATPPTNSYTKQVIRESHPWPRGIIRDLIEEGGPLHNVPVCSYRYLMAEIKHRSHGPQLQARAETLNQTIGSKIIEEMGFRKHGRIKVNNKTEIAYITPWGVRLGEHDFPSDVIRNHIKEHNYPSEWNED